MSSPAAQAAVFEWQEGARRYAAVAESRRAPIDAVIGAVQTELRRRLGTSFTVADLADEYAFAAGWFLEVAIEVAPRAPEAHDGALTMDAAFARFMRHAQDARLW